MAKIIICPDSFKGSLSAAEAAGIVSKAAKDSLSNVETVLIPIADGGEGTVDALGAKKRTCFVKDAFLEDVEAFWGEMGDAAVIELAACAGLPMAKELNPEKTSTYGVGQLILSALDFGKRKIVIALGGSSTNDFGCGMAAALGAHFLDEKGDEFIPVGGTLSKIHSIDLSRMDSRLAECEIITMCDVTNPLYGESGAAYVFAPQKGADPEMVVRLDKGLRHVAKIVERDAHVDVSALEGAGAAGGCGGGVVAFLKSRLQSGIDVVLDLNSFDEKLGTAKLVVTGEGKFDSQSVDGKAISGIAKRCKEKGIPLIVLAGCADESETAYDLGVTAAFSIQRKALPLEEAKKINDVSLYKTAYNVFKLIRSFSEDF